MSTTANPKSFKEFVALRNDFVLKKDGNRIILYPLDCVESSFFVLDPLQGFVLSLLDGTRRFSDIVADFHAFFPYATDSLSNILQPLDGMIKRSPTQSGIGSEGLFQESDLPIECSFRHDPREFIVSVQRFNETMNNIREAKRLATPINIMAFFTHKCQTNCMYCYAQRNRTQEMSLDQWRQIIQQMQYLDIKLISLDGGDPIARHDGIDFLEDLVKADLLFLLSTKGFFSRESVRRLVDAGFRQKIRYVCERKVQLSVDAWDDEKSAIITGNPRFKDNISKTFDNFMNVGIVPKIKSVLMPINADQPLRIVEYFYPRGARRFQFVRYTRSFFNHRDTFFFDDRSIRIAQNQMEEICSRYPDVDLTENIISTTFYHPAMDRALRQRIWSGRSGCGGGWSMLGIAPNGRAILCEQMVQDEPYCVGDLTRQSITDVWRCDEMLGFIYPTRDKFIGTVCYDCEDFEACHWEKGYCYRDAYFSYATVYQAPPLCPKQCMPGLRLT